jgi:thiamine biosynthesis lipoprotein
MILDKEAHTVELTKPGMMLDLGGIGKGFAADAAIKVLDKEDITRALIAAGGDVAVSDAPPGTEGWKVAIASLEPTEKPKRYLILKRQAVSTSGDAEQHVDIAGKRYSHIINPKTGIGLPGRMSVTVVGSLSTRVDPMTKVVSVLGPEKGFAVLDKLPSFASLVVREADGKVEELESTRFKDIPQERR